MHMRPIYTVVKQDGSPLPTDNFGYYIDFDGKPIPTDASGTPLGVDGLPLPTNGAANYVVFSEEEAISKSLPSDKFASVIYTVTKPDLLPTTSEQDVFPTDESGDVLYPLVRPDKTLIAGEGTATLVNEIPGRYVVVNEERRPLPTNEYGSALRENGLPLPTDALGRPVDQMNTPYPTNVFGEYVVPPMRRHSVHCFVKSHIELVVVLDTSNSVKVLDYRVMKELLKGFLSDHFDMTKDKVRIAVVKYGETVEIPVSLGDYDFVEDLLHRISETRRVKGKALLGSALKDVAGELLISGTEEVPKFVLLLKNGASL
ncbi:unnamed protein product [Heligmosomoides polygyrus]|uniref:VWFA domain-containing protein n=1 Tax=Heligmosomoides polygyrus TaxID=6339 RepID=A0A183F550_HELPZ|nr:unnamed protein product [Heligmosomoides polygyrus]